MVAKGWGAREWEEKGAFANWYMVSFCSDINILRLDCCDGYTTLNVWKSTELYSLTE